MIRNRMPVRNQSVVLFTVFSPVARGVLAVGLLVCILANSVSKASEPIDFQRDVAPILAEHCLDCHSDDFAENGLNLQTPAAARKGGDSGEPAVVPGSPESSYLISRITTSDAGERMPPDADPLPPEQVETLRRWIAERSLWADVGSDADEPKLNHWSFQPLDPPQIPRVTDPDTGARVDHPIDAFIVDRLEREGLSPSPRATDQRLVRRLKMVMHGLPPTLNEQQQYTPLARTETWHQLVDQVLASPHYGERWATFWLDLVRFGETHGFETNRERPHAWRYRDWVIESLNEDKPYDQFVIEQLAGDAVGQGVATGFLVAGPYDLVKGQDALLQLTQRQDELADILNTTGTAFLGLTLGCARCHNHKFDPISQTDYYAMQAVFAGVQHGDRALPPDSETLRQIEEIDLRLAELDAALNPYRAGPRLARVPDEEQPQPAQRRAPVTAVGNDDYFQPTPARMVRFTILETNGGQPCLDELEVFAKGRNVALASAGARATSGGDFVHPLHKLEHIHDGQYGNAHSWIAEATTGWVQIELPEQMTVDRVRWARDSLGQYPDRVPVEYQIEVSSDGDQWTLVASHHDRLPFGSESPSVPTYDFQGLAPAERDRLTSMRDERERLTERREQLNEPVMAYAGAFEQPGTVHRLYRGDPTAPREPVVPAAIQSLSKLQLTDATPEQQRRLAIARWIASSENPLTARVLVNRIWQHHFGTGIVDTPSDFGRNGTPPSHPELLDWLAAELIRSGWSIKHLQRLILTSQTWQQDSRPVANAMARDADSRLLWRFPPRRLEAEAIRDAILLATGKLGDQMGGPGFSAFEVQQENVRHYFPKSEFGPEDWRRMVYMTRVRQERDAVFGVFDCPDFNQVVPARSRSTTPLQALNLFNSPFVMQQAELLVDRIQAEASGDRAQVELAYRICFSREASADEVDQALQLVESTSWFQLARVLLNSNEFLFLP